MARNVIIIGAGGHAKVIADIVIKSSDNLIGFLDDNIDSRLILGYPILGKIKDTEKYNKTCEFIIGIGDNYARKRIAKKFIIRWYTAIHPTAQIALNVIVGEGTTIMANTIINSSTNIGSHCIVNSGAVIEHDNHIADYAHISPNATLCGTVAVGELTHIGASSTVINNIDICSDVTIGAGAVVVRGIKEKGSYVGVPTRMVTLLEEK